MFFFNRYSSFSKYTKQIVQLLLSEDNDVASSHKMGKQLSKNDV